MLIMLWVLMLMPVHVRAVMAMATSSNTPFDGPQFQVHARPNAVVPQQQLRHLGRADRARGRLPAPPGRWIVR